MSDARVITAIDDNYLLPLLIMAFSAKKHSDKKFELIIGYDDRKLSSQNRDLITACLEILQISFRFISVHIDDQLLDNSHITSTAYVRLYLADILEGIVLWLDADLICLPNWDDLFRDYREDLTRVLVAGVRDPIVTRKKVRNYSKNMSLLHMGDDYFNSGVLLINCDFWNEVDVPESWPIVAKNYENLGFEFSDQCILNYMCKDSYRLLPQEFNQLALGGRSQSEIPTKILHFAGPIKPWDYKRFSPMIVLSKLRRCDINRYLKVQSELIQQVGVANISAKKELKDISKVLVSRKSRLFSLKENLVMRLVLR